MGREGNDGVGAGPEAGGANARDGAPDDGALLLGATAQISDPTSKMNTADRNPGLSAKYLNTLPPGPSHATTVSDGECIEGADRQGC